MEALLLLILLALCAILIAIPKSALSQREHCDQQFDALLARERVLQQMHNEYVRATQRNAKRERLYAWLGLAWLRHKLRWVPPTIAVLMVGSVPVYFIGCFIRIYLG